MDCLLKVVGLLLIGLRLVKFQEFFFALFGACSLRLWAGGYHCKNSISCFGAMMIICLCSVYGAPIMSQVWPGYIVVVFFIFLLTLIRYAPGQMRSNLITDPKIYVMKKRRAIAWLLGEFLLILLLKNGEWRWILTLAIFFEIVSIIPTRNNQIHLWRVRYEKQK